MPKCEATTYPIYWWSKQDIDFKPCSRNASVRIDGINLCMQHAGTIAVLKLIHHNMAEKLSTANQYGPLCPLKNEDRWRKRIL